MKGKSMRDSPSKDGPMKDREMKDRDGNRANGGDDGEGAYGAENAIMLLLRQHREVDTLFERFEESDSGSPESMAIAQDIAFALNVHARLEEEIFYPAAREALGEDGKDLLDEAAVEHATFKQLLVDLGTSLETDYFFGSKVKVLGEYVQHHVEEEESELFPMLQDAGLDLEELGRAMQERRDALHAAYPEFALRSVENAEEAQRMGGAP